MEIVGLTVEHRDNPQGIDASSPRLGWKLVSEGRAKVQRAYRILVAGSRERLSAGEGDVWDSGKVASGQSTHVAYGGQPLSSGKAYYWKVRVWDEKGVPSRWSDTGQWSMGLLDAGEWNGEWIGYNVPEGEFGQAACCLRKTFVLLRPVRRAMLYATALGLYEIFLGDSRVGCEYLTPGWTNYSNRVLYQSYDVTERLASGANAIAVLLGAGWYSGHVAHIEPGFYGRSPSLLLRLAVEHDDGSRTDIVSDGSWKVSRGGIVYSDLIMGETCDARLEPTGWRHAGFDDSTWPFANVMEPYAGRIQAPKDDGVRIAQTITPIAVNELGAGRYIVDMGQNMAGWVRLKAEGQAGDTIKLRFAEMLDGDGVIYTASLRSAKQQDEFILAGGAPETFEPHFTYHGFRFVEIEGYPGELSADSVEGVVLHSGASLTGRLETGHSGVNRLHSNAAWSMRGNFISVPTDCPQRDERLGWLGDAQIFARTATFMGNVAAFYEKWMEDVEADQFPSGAFPDIAPYMPFVGGGTAGWGDAGVIVPWTVYQVYGDPEILRRHFDAMIRWIAYLQDTCTDLIRPDEGYGDWLSIGAETPKDVLATAYFGYSVKLTAAAAEAIGKQEEAERLQSLFCDIREAFIREFVTSDGRVKGETQAGYVLALHMDLLPIDLRPLAAARLAGDIESKGRHLSTGFLGVGYLLPVLSEAGYTDLAYGLLLQDTFPSWLYSVRNGATTIWERWDGWTAENGFQDPGMNSFNHYSLGSVAEWMYRYMAGIDLKPDRPGYSDFSIYPRLSETIGHCRAEFESVYGTIVSEWRIEGGSVSLCVSVPVNACATLYVPVLDNRISGLEAVTESGKPVMQAESFEFQGFEDNRAMFRLGSGNYSFVSRFR
ncbi:family 78 glycoside hydrolase catalytic domain [Cohnella silvisoli]|uniref:alpha-L-rhamnosidase n=1 Tax=Cohnella silvisoli TaxID=2873699 RepID=A0ABV1KMZ0_9BACL